MLKLGVIGYGVRMRSVVKDILECGGVTLCAVADPDPEVIKLGMEKSKHGECAYYKTAEEMLESEELDGVCVGTRCSLHTKYAIEVAKRGIPLFLEKPVSTTYSDLERLKAISYHSDKTVVSFPLRLTALVEYVKEIIDSGRLGEIQHVQGYNNVPYGRGYYHKWYRDEEETGGLFLQKATHDLDYINYLLGNKKPVSVCAMKSKQIFLGDKPKGLKCADCHERATCPESPENVRKLGDGYSIGEYCCFSEDTGNEDSGSLIVQYDDGMHVVYSQDFIVRGGAGKRGARLIGYYGTLEFDFYTGEVTVFQHTRPVTEKHTFTGGTEGHFGGDGKLAMNFVNVMKGVDISHATLKEGILSAEMCLGAKKSAEEKIFVNIN